MIGFEVVGEGCATEGVAKANEEGVNEGKRYQFMPPLRGLFSVSVSVSVLSPDALLKFTGLLDSPEPNELGLALRQFRTELLGSGTLGQGTEPVVGLPSA